MRFLSEKSLMDDVAPSRLTESSRKCYMKTIENTERHVSVFKYITEAFLFSRYYYYCNSYYNHCQNYCCYIITTTVTGTATTTTKITNTIATANFYGAFLWHSQSA